jgi:hypothetical protein
MARRDLDRFIDETRDRQRNVVFPDTVRNGRSVDAFLWKGSSNPPLVQRIAAWLFGLVFIGFGLVLLSAAARVRNEDHSLIGGVVITLISLSSALLGIRLFRNGFPRRVKTPQNSNESNGN